MRWHHSVHERLGEHLVYYRTKAGTPIKLTVVADRLRALLEAEHLPSVRAFMIFGPYDLLFRAWMHPNIISSFRYKLAEALGVDTSPQHFAVRQITRKSYTQDDAAPTKQGALWHSILDIHTLRAIQAGDHPRLLGELLDSHFIVERPIHERNTLRFYSAITVHVEDPLLESLANEIDVHVLTRQNIIRPAVYIGDGFCNILLRGEVVPEHFYTIGELTDFLITKLHPHKGFTETYLVAFPDTFIGDQEMIDDRTFIERRGRDPFVEGVIPEVYDTLSSRSDEIIHFLLDKARGNSLTDRDKILLGSYLKGYLNDQPSASAVALLLFFTELEAYLRKTYAKFIGLNGFKLKDILQDAGIAKDLQKHHISLGECFNILAKAIEKLNQPDLEQLCGNWQDLITLRNQPAHGDFEFTSWRNHVSTLVRDLPRVQRLVDLISRSTNIKPEFTAG